MEELIKQAFLQVDVLGPQVQEGHYDLIGPNGEIILPSVWERVVEPDWAITMTMWPMDKRPSAGPRMPTGGMHPGLGRPGMGGPMPPPMGRMRMPPGVAGPAGRRPPGGGMPGGPEWIPGRRERPLSAHNIDIIDVGPGGPGKKDKKDKKAKPTMLGFLAGKPPKKK